MMIQATGLTHFYGPNPAIQDVNFGVEKGEILGFLGPNGAGKTTTMRIITGYMPPTRGQVSLDGFDVVEQSLQARRKIGYLPETVPLYTDMNVSNYLKYMGTLRGMPPKNINRRVGEVVDVCRLGDYRKTIIGKLSKGFRQRVGIAQAIIHEPEVLVLDEPTIGIDPIQVVETRRLIQDLGKAQTVVLSSHILPEVSMICQRVMIINEGRIVAEDTPDNLAKRLQGVNRLEVEVSGPREEVLPALRKIAGVSDVTFQSGQGRSVYIVQAQGGEDLRDQISRAVISSGWGLLSMQMVGMSLEEIFLKLTTHEEL
ncbi:MAG: MFS transporter [SAR202 cluster bacterium Io17-Chloro-G9]|nr:MAG: MFS transporter [SAR202 cluster bacterium Io17-Chloro-G9]